MDSTDVALGRGGDGEGYYERCGAEAGVPGLARIFEMLSQDEVRHAAALRLLQEGAMVELPQSQTLEGARPILRRLAVEETALSRFNGDPGRYRFAMDSEAANVRLFGALAREAANGWKKELLLKIAAEHEVHFTLLESIRELLEPLSREGEGKRGVADAR